MRVSDLIRAGGNLEASAYGSHAELSRYTIDKGEQRRTQILAIDLAAVARGDATANVELQPFDQLSVKEISGWTENDRVTLMGEVKFPGNYTIKRGESLRSVIERAGGLTDLAFPEGSVFTREGLRIREQEQLDRLATRMQSDIASVSLMAARASQSGASAAYSVGQSLLSQLQSTRAVGRLVIDLKSASRAAPGTAEDIVLRNDDLLIVPKQRQDVMVLGEVQSASSHMYRPELARDDYIAQSGGTTRQADQKKIYVVRADGSVVANRDGWFQRASNVEIHAGDAVVVPLDTERLPALPMWQSITQILYNIAIAAAAVHSFK
jgi:protein involved in polysaccharide export with SLBB domain